MNYITELFTIEIIGIYLFLSIYTVCALIYDDLRDQKVLRKKTIITHIIWSFIPGYNLIVTVFWTLGNLFSFFYSLANESEPDSLEARENYVFGFLKYKNIEMTELDDYIESRTLLKKMTDKLQ